MGTMSATPSSRPVLGHRLGVARGDRVEVAAGALLDDLALGDPALASGLALGGVSSRLCACPLSSSRPWYEGTLACERSASASPAITLPTAAAPPSPAARTSRLPTITPSAISATARA